MLVHFHQNRVLGFQDKYFKPGINDVPAELVADMQEDEVLAGKFDRGELEIIEPEDLGATKIKKKKGAEPSAVEVFLAASDRNAKDMVGKTVDLEILKLWLKREKRVPVRKLIRARVESIENIQYREESKKSKFEKSAQEGDEE